MNYPQRKLREKRERAKDGSVRDEGFCTESLILAQSERWRRG